MSNDFTAEARRLLNCSDETRTGKSFMCHLSIDTIAKALADAYRAGADAGYALGAMDASEMANDLVDEYEGVNFGSGDHVANEMKRRGRWRE